MDIDQFRPDSDFWGKLSPRDAPSSWHPVADHCIDVSVCARALLGVAGIRGRLAQLARSDDLDATQCDRLAFIVGLHDLGKFNHGFQDRIRPGAQQVGHTRELTQLMYARVDLSRELSEAAELPRLASWVEDPAMLEGLLLAAFAHHGGPLSHDGDPAIAGLWRPRGGRDPFSGIRQLVLCLRRAFPGAFAAEGTAIHVTPEFQHAFAGMVMLADWLGSDMSVFPYTEPGDPHREETSRPRAAELLRSIGIDASQLRSAVRALALEPPSLFGFPAARPVQELLAELPLPKAGTGSLVVLEAETGSGKTEAAWWWFARLLASGQVDGLYFALPTRSAATQLHQRLVDYKQRWGEMLPAVVQAVPGYLRADDASGKRIERLGPFEVLWDDAPDAAARARYWAAEGSKRYLAAAMGVGTVDQVLLSTLKVKHAHLRAFGLLRHLLVVDEVHASDPYMDRILAEVLRHHLDAGGHALLMSATLGSSLRGQLEGLAGPPVEPVSVEEAVGVPYPRASFRYLDGTSGSTFGDLPEVGKDVAVDAALLAEGSDAIARVALEAARQGARVLVIRNTVGGCLEVQRSLEDLASTEDQSLLFRCEGQVAPHHSRFTAEDRICLDRAVEASFGKEAPAGGCVLIATQTVEQSLDIDADLMLTDLCPIDVLLQRIGRLHRHVRGDRPSAFQQPRCRLLVPSRGLEELLEERRFQHGWGSVYPDLRMLAATLGLVAQRSTWSIPRDNRWLVEHGTHPDALAAVGTRASWTEHAQQRLGEHLAQVRIARDVLVPWGIGFDDRRMGPFPRRVEQKIQTRLGEDDRRIEVPEPLVSPFGSRITEIRIPGHLARGICPEPEAVLLARDPIRVGLPGHELTYSRYGTDLITKE